jgi:hypothetical protein
MRSNKKSVIIDAKNLRYSVFDESQGRTTWATSSTFAVQPTLGHREPCTIGAVEMYEGSL